MTREEAKCSRNGARRKAVAPEFEKYSAVSVDRRDSGHCVPSTVSCLSILVLFLIRQLGLLADA